MSLRILFIRLRKQFPQRRYLTGLALMLAIIHPLSNDANAITLIRTQPLESSSRYHCVIREDRANRLAVPRQTGPGNSLRFRLIKYPALMAQLKATGALRQQRALLRASRECRRLSLAPTPVPSEPTTPPVDRTPEPEPTAPGPTPTASPTPTLTLTPTPTAPPTPSPEDCFDHIDNDLDLAVDDEDTDCASLGTTYYVSNAEGNDEWSGLLPIPNQQGTDGPLKTLAAAVSVLRTEAQPGDRVLLRRGDTWQNHSASSTALGISGVRGAAQAPITLGAYGTGNMRPRIDIGGTAGLIMSVSNQTQYMIIKDLTLTTTAPLGQRPQGISVLDCSGDEPPSHVIFDNLEITDLRYGLTLQGNHLTLKNSVIRNNFKSGPLEEGGHTQGLYAGKQCGGGSFIHILNNRFENNGAKESVFDWNAYLSCTDCSFVGNYVTDGSAGLKVRNCSRIHVADNVFSDINSVGISVGGSGGLVSEDITIERNVIRRTIDGITIVRQSIGAGLIRRLAVLNNILMDNLARPSEGGDYPGYILVATNDDREDVLIAHNTLHQIRHKAGIYINADAGDEAAPQVDVRLKNNLIQIADTSIPALYMRGDATTLMSIDYNLYDAERKVRGDANQYFNSLADARAVFPALDIHGREGDAGLVRTETSVGTLPILSGVGAGLNSAQCLPQVPDDFFGTARPVSLCDIGAEEGL